VTGRLGGRGLGLLLAAQLAVSWTLLSWASLSRDVIPRWPRILDVVLAFTIVFTAALLRGLAEREPSTRRIADIMLSQVVASTLPSLVLLIAWLLRERIDWNILLPGLAWRLFITQYSLPAALTAWRTSMLVM
jgi:hypothetical protein